MSPLNCTGIEPNPDISGIGVRAAIYTQAVLTLVQPILASVNGQISEDTLTGLHQIYLGILLPGCALLFSAIIQARTFGLSVYHGIVVLNLSWINNTSALIFFQFALITQRHLDEERAFRKTVGVMWKMLSKTIEFVVTSRTLEISERQKLLIGVKNRAAAMRMALRKREKFEWSKEILADVIQKLSLILAEIPDKFTEATQLPELTNFLEDTNNDPQFRKALGMPDRMPDRPYGVTRKWEVRSVKGVMSLLQATSGVKQVVDLLGRDWIMAALASAHLILFSAFGVWLWSTIHRFGECESFTKFTTINIFVSIPVISQPLRIASILIYTISLLPFVNIVIFGGLEYGVILGWRQLFASIWKLIAPIRNREMAPSRQSDHTRRDLLEFVALTFLVQAYFIITTELTIRDNRHLLDEQSDAQESHWTFGQTLVMFLIFIPLVQLFNDDNAKVFQRCFRRKKGRKEA